MRMEMRQAFMMNVPHLANLIKSNELPVPPPQRNLFIIKLDKAKNLWETSAQATEWNALIIRGIELRATELHLEDVQGELMIRYIVDGVIVTDGKM